MISATPNSEISLQMTKSYALNEEMRRKKQDTSSHSEVLVTDNRVRSLKKEHNISRDKSRSKSKSQYKNVECHSCHKIGHIKKNCFFWKKESKDKKGKQREKDFDDGDHVITTTCGDLVCLCDYDTINLVSDESMWIIDSGVTLHVTSRKKLFTSYTPDDFGVLKMGNDGVSKVIGVSDGHLQSNIRMQLFLRGVKHAQDVRFNLISLQVVDDGGYDNHFGSAKWKLTKGLVAKDNVNVVYMESFLGDRRLGHIRLKSAELEKCSHCMAGKQTRVSFKKHSPSMKSEFLEFVHFDVCGLLKSSKKLKCIRINNGGEHIRPFAVYCRQYGIAHEKTSPKTPLLNDLTERINRTLIERVRCILSEAKLAKHFWGEALLTSVRFINLSSAIALNSEVLDKTWFDKNVTYDHLLVFGCKAFVHVPKDERFKLDVKTRQCIFIGFDQTIEDIDKVEKSTPKEDGHVADFDRIQLSVKDLDIDVHDDEHHDDTDNKQVGDGLNDPINNVDEEEHDMSQYESLGDEPELP
ncbi:hypothetical protein V8G54_004456 [Vigna mungo]|uniref:Integrase catalytic domain-containing protein n=1 Tax=Vigna mungo TaxID=3915 RepID=A0AAQ3PGF7_VIGMU